MNGLMMLTPYFIAAFPILMFIGLIGLVVALALNWPREAAAGFAVAGIVGAAGMFWTLLESVPAYQTDLQGTTWAFVEIDGTPVVGEATVTFRDGLTVVIATACRTTDVGYALDTDGAALGFGDMGPTPVGCTGEASAQDRAVKNALLSVTEWRVLDSDHIRFIGGPPVTLARQPRSNPG